MTTILEFLHPVRSGSQRDQVLGVMYWCKHYDDRHAVNIPEIRAELQRARISTWRRMNVTEVLNRAVPYADRIGPRGIWEITGTGERYLADDTLLEVGSGPVEQEVGGLAKVAAGIGDDVVRGYVEEAVKCLSAGALRAAVVFLWTGAARTLQERALAKGAMALNAALLKHDSKARDVSKVEDFAWIKDKTLLLACGELGLLDKGERSTLEDALNLRNRCGHPTRYKPGAAKASSFIEDVVGLIWP